MKTLSSEQAKALGSIAAWLKAYEIDGKKQYLTIGGYAGTGKTTLLAALRKILADNRPNMRLSFAAYTGKATQVLKARLRQHKTLVRGDAVSTLHSLIYNSETKSDGSVAWRRKTELKTDLIIIDEASMVSEDLWQDIISYRVPILAVGDHGQLPPINSSFSLMADPDIRLEKIWRQAAGSPIIKLATLARTTGNIPVGDYGPGVKKLDRSDPQTGDMIEEILQSYGSDTMVLCGYNHTRQKLNHHIRELKEFESADPARGDTIVCLRNSRVSGLSNGQIGTIQAILSADEDPDNLWWYIVADFDGQRFEGYALREQFGSKTTISHPPKRPKDQITGLFDFGYGLTVHKAQGSQSKKVLIFEERFPQMNQEEWQRWLYTAVTRAEKELYIVGT
ncbi:MAG: AAA family ATPase [Candidatus Saccharibacteria bacterium]